MHPTSTGLMTAAQQHARSGNALPSPPPLPPPPRAMSSSPASAAAGGVADGTGAGATGIGRPPFPARPPRPTDQPSGDMTTSAPIGNSDHVTVVDRSMALGHLPLPPPPPSGQPGSTLASGTNDPSAGVQPSSPSLSAMGAAGPPALKPRPSKDHEMWHGMLGPRKTPATGINSHGFGGVDMVSSSSNSGGGGGGGGGSGEDQSQRMNHWQVVAPALPNANALIHQLVNMGFTREQSRSALEKYDYDLEKCHEPSLDWDK